MTPFVPLFFAAPRALWLGVLLAVLAALEVRARRRGSACETRWRGPLAARLGAIGCVVIAIAQPCWRLALPVPIGEDTWAPAPVLPLWPYFLIGALVLIPFDAWLRRHLAESR